MFPAFTQSNPRDSTFLDPELGGKIMANAVDLWRGFYLPDLIFSEFGRTLMFPSCRAIRVYALSVVVALSCIFRMRYRPMAALFDHIRHVLSMSAQPKMGRIHTRGRIAFVKDKGTIGYRAIVKHPGKAVCILKGLIPRPADDTITSASLRGYPKPAGWGLIDLSPESLFKWYTFHVVDLLYRLTAIPRPVSAGAGVIYVPNYSTFGGGTWR